MLPAWKGDTDAYLLGMHTHPKFVLMITKEYDSNDVKSWIRLCLPIKHYKTLNKKLTEVHNMYFSDTPNAYLPKYVSIGGKCSFLTSGVDILKL